MNGVHDMGGMDGFGPVQPEENEPVFHEEWEGRVLAMNRCMGYSRTWNGDISRHAKEILPPHVYLVTRDCMIGTRLPDPTQGAAR